jgi:phage terminase large subunit-like protein
MTAMPSFSPQTVPAACASPWALYRDRAAARAAAAQQAASRPRLSDDEFAERYLKHTALFPATGPARWFEPADFHRKLSALADEQTRLLIHIAREHAKTSRFSIVRVLRLIAEDREVRILLVSKTERAARKIVGTVLRQLAFNERLISDYGRFEPSRAERREKRLPWSDEALTVLRRSTSKEPTLTALGRGGQVVSGRYDVVVIDDIEDSASTWTPDARQKTFDWFERDVLPVVQSGSVWIIATPWAEDDLVGRLKLKGGWTYVNIPAERPLSPGEQPQGTGDGRTPGDARIARASSWSEKWSLYWTDCDVRKAELRGASDTTLASIAKGAACASCPVFNKSAGDTGGVGCLTGKRFHDAGPVAYALQYLVRIEALGGDIFQASWFRRYTHEQVRQVDGVWQWLERKPDGSITGHELEIVCGVDPAISEKDERPDGTHSNFAVVVLGYARRLGLKLFLDCVDDRMDHPAAVERLAEVVAAWRPRWASFEETGYQRALRQDLKIRCPGLAAHTEKVFADKRTKFISLTGDTYAGRVLLPAESAEAFVPSDRSHRAHHAQRARRCAAILKQAAQFPRGTHDDLLDGWWLAERVIGKARMLETSGGPLVREYSGALAGICDDGDTDPGGWTRFDPKLPLRMQGIV